MPKLSQLQPDSALSGAEKLVALDGATTKTIELSKILGKAAEQIEVSAVENVAALATLDSEDHSAVYVVETGTIYRWSATDPGAGSGTLPGATGFWVPQFYRTTGLQTGLRVGVQKNVDDSENPGFVNRSVLKVVVPPETNVPIASFAIDSPGKPAGLLFVGINWPNGDYSTEIWARGNMTDASFEAALTIRGLINGTTTRQIGVGVLGARTMNPARFRPSGTPAMRDDAVLFWVGHGYNFAQDTAGNPKNTALAVYGKKVAVNGWLQRKTVRYATDFTVTEAASTYIYTGSGGIATLPVSSTDGWGNSYIDGAEINLINLGTGPLTLSTPVRLDAATTINVLNHIDPDNRLPLQYDAVGGEWIKTS